jgi:hypothetical protein
MIASGGLSGGLSSAIAGGNFWSGVREGLITSGLNHAMHSVVNKIQTKRTINQRIRAAGLDPDAKAPETAEEATCVAETVLGDLYEDAKRPNIEVHNSLGKSDFGEEIGGLAVPGQLSGNLDLEYSLTIKPYMKLSKIVFKSYHSLVATIGHELIHIKDYHGDYLLNLRIGKTYAYIMTEINAHRWEFNHNSNTINMPRFNALIDYHLFGTDSKYITKLD